MADHPTARIPLPLRLYALFLILTGIAGSVAGWVNPGILFGTIPLPWHDYPHAFLNGLWGSRNVAVTALLIAALVLSDARLLLAGYLVRFLTEAQDLLILAPLRGPEGELAVRLVMVAVVVVPEGIGTVWLWRLTCGRRAAIQHQGAAR